MSKILICSACGAMGSSKSHTRGSILIEIILWLCFLIPGIIYSLWRISSREKVCRQCGSDLLIPVNSPRGRKLHEELYGSGNAQVKQGVQNNAGEISHKAPEFNTRSTAWQVPVVVILIASFFAFIFYQATKPSSPSLNPTAENTLAEIKSAFESDEAAILAEAEGYLSSGQFQEVVDRYLKYSYVGSERLSAILEEAYSGLNDARSGWVTVDSLNRRTCPASTCGVVGVLYFREKADILEEKDGWVRTTKYYDASCINGKSEYVDSGNSQCVSSNGINNGEFAEWVASKYLASTRPADPAAGAPAEYDLIKGSDDFRLHKDAFAAAADKLIASGRCTAGEFQEMGGWMKSVNQRDKPIYFMYCGGMHSRYKVYLNAVTGEIDP